MPGEVNIPPTQADLAMTRELEQKLAHFEELQERRERQREAEITAQALRAAANDAEQRAGTTTDDLAFADDEMFVRLDWLRERADRLEAEHG